MIEQESNEADNSSRVPTVRQACNETAAAISAMLVWALPGRSLALPLRHRVRAMRMPALGPAALVAAAVFWAARAWGISDALLPGSHRRISGRACSYGLAAERDSMGLLPLMWGS
jgi:hypothetical protein